VLLLGLTGGIGSGKSTVSAMLAEREAVIVDADAIVRQIQRPGGPAFSPMVERFGPGIVAEDGTIDRPAVAALVFGDPSALRDLNAITHPLVGAEMAARMATEATTDHVVVLDIPLLAEGSGRSPGMAGVLVVDTPVEVAVHRLVSQRGLDEADARARVAAQASRQERRALADFVICNGGTLAQLAVEVDRAWAWIEGLEPSP